MDPHNFDIFFKIDPHNFDSFQNWTLLSNFDIFHNTTLIILTFLKIRLAQNWHFLKFDLHDYLRYFQKIDPSKFDIFQKFDPFNVDIVKIPKLEWDFFLDFQTVWGHFNNFKPWLFKSIFQRYKSRANLLKKSAYFSAQDEWIRVCERHLSRLIINLSIISSC